ncbi:MAG TPA: inorganic phosphate transporter [Actinomycetota bacterium]|nr:inorganic phosphate transporter [Actinomycetota bacterium]
MVWFCLGLAYLFEFANGWTDAPNSIATVVSTRVMRPHHAVLMAAAMNLIGALVVGTAVAETIAEGIVNPDYVGLDTVASALLAATLWAVAAQAFGLPSSESHALIAGLLGAGFAAGGLQALESEGTQAALVGLVTSPVGGFLMGLVLMVLIYRFFHRVRRALITRVFGKAQVGSAAFMAFSHGTNDAQKTMGIIALTIALNEAGTAGNVEDLTIDLWMIVSAALVMGLGTMVGGWRVVRTMGMRMTRLEPVQGFAAETGAATVITAAASIGIPVSTTHAIGSAIMGVGATKRFSAVRWGVAGQVVAAWVLTWPSCALLGYLFQKAFSLFS